jgi:hypothetical protein
MNIVFSVRDKLESNIFICIMLFSMLIVSVISLACMISGSFSLRFLAIFNLVHFFSSLQILSNNAGMPSVVLTYFILFRYGLYYTIEQ